MSLRGPRFRSPTLEALVAYGARIQKGISIKLISLQIRRFGRAIFYTYAVGRLARNFHNPVPLTPPYFIHRQIAVE
jgi:hypothetical protein